MVVKFGQLKWFLVFGAWCLVLGGAMGSSRPTGCGHAGTTAETTELKNGQEFALAELPEKMSVQLKRGGSIRFLMEENGTTGYQWEATYSKNECEVGMEHRTTADGRAGAPGKAAITIIKNAAVQSPSFVEFQYLRSWETGVKPLKTVRVVLYTIPGETVDFKYPRTRILDFLKTECAARGIELIDWHVHIRGGLTPEMAVEREKACGFKQSAMENHGREWEIFNNAQLVKFAERSRKANPEMPVGIQVNDRDWFKQIDAETRARFDYILADTMIMGKLPNGRDKRLWLIEDISEIGDPEKWMDEYVAMNLQILVEPISILANPSYLPTPLNAMHDKLWTEERMRKVIGKAVERGIAIEIQAESPYPSPKFLKLAKEMGAKFSFGTNNYDAAPKDLSRWLEAIVWLDLHGEDIWTPKCLKR